MTRSVTRPQGRNLRMTSVSKPASRQRLRAPSHKKQLPLTQFHHFQPNSISEFILRDFGKVFLLLFFLRS
jgi:hypothetical protein